MKIPSIFKKDAASIHHAAFWLGFFAIVSGLLGLFRDRILAGMFGASRTLDIYYSAFRVPDFLYTLMLFLTSATAIIPFIIKKIDTDKSEAENFFGSILLFFSFLAAILCIIAFFLMPFLVRFLFPGFSSDDKNLTSLISKFMLLSPFFLGVSNIFSAVTQSFKRFFAYALSPVFYNLGIIFGILFFLPIFGIPGLGLGVIVGSFLHMGVQIPALAGTDFLPKFKKFFFGDIKKIILLSVPRTFGLTINQISILVFTSVASTLSSGSIAVFNLAQNLGYIPITVVGLSYSVAAFPNLASFSLRKNKSEFEEHFSSAFRHIIFWTVPFSALLLVLRAQVVRVILGSGVFSWSDTRLTAASLFLLALSIVFQSLFLLLVRSFYAEGETKKPLFVNILSVIFSVASVFLFVKILSASFYFSKVFASLLSISDIADIRVLALSFGILTGSVFNFIFLLFAFKMVFGWLPIKKSKKSLFEIFSGSFVGAISAHFGLYFFSLIFDLHSFLGIFLQGLFAGLLGIFFVVMTLHVLRNREFFEVYESLKSTIWRDHVPAPEPEKLP